MASLRLADHLLDRTRDRGFYRVGDLVLICHDQAGAPDGDRLAGLLLDLAPRLVVQHLAADGTQRGADRGRREERRCEQANHEADRGEPLGTLLDHVIGLLYREVRRPESSWRGGTGGNVHGVRSTHQAPGFPRHE